ncbi:MAG: hypothetical protein VYD83_00530, partial [SAR324 cluster bacterium]|nr:hypothetical protein [SAR324 cluster bacterium]
PLNADTHSFPLNADTHSFPLNADTHSFPLNADTYSSPLLGHEIITMSFIQNSNSGLSRKVLDSLPI